MAEGGRVEEGQGISIAHSPERPENTAMHRQPSLLSERNDLNTHTRSDLFPDCMSCVGICEALSEKPTAPQCLL